MNANKCPLAILDIGITKELDQLLFLVLKGYHGANKNTSMPL